MNIHESQWFALGLDALSSKTACWMILWCLETARFGLYFLYRSEIWQASRQLCCRNICQISERYDYNNTESRGLEALRE